jgi:hypothetical protein
MRGARDGKNIEQLQEGVCYMRCKDQSKNHNRRMLLNLTAKKQRFTIHIKNMKMHLDADVNLAEAVNAL